MSRYKTVFLQLKQKKIGAFVPFITIGDPDPITFIKIIDILIQSGSDALELGIPFSDPISDGSSIQKSIQRSLKSGTNFSNCFTLIKKIRAKYPNLPIGLLVYANLIFKNGIHRFYKHCSELEIDSVLIPDLPIEENYLFYKSANDHKISYIFICPPNATNDLIHKITTNSNNGYVYLISRPGVTGKNKNTFDYSILNILISNIKKHRSTLPILQGFGVYTPKQAQISVQSGTNGVILGSIIADIIEQYSPYIKHLLKELKQFTQLIKNAMKF